MIDCGTDRLFFQAITGGGIKVTSLSTVTFILSMLIALATGTSWGTMAILFPLVVVPSWEASQNVDIVLGVTGSMHSGSVAGDHVSPISDTTVLSSISSECGLMAHVQTQAPYATFVAFW